MSGPLERIEEIKRLIECFDTAEILEAMAQQYLHTVKRCASWDDTAHHAMMASKLRELILLEDENFFSNLASKIEEREKNRIDSMMRL